MDGLVEICSATYSFGGRKMRTGKQGRSVGVREVGLDREMPCSSMWLVIAKTYCTRGSSWEESWGAAYFGDPPTEREREIFGVAFGGLVPIENEGND